MTTVEIPVDESWLLRSGGTPSDLARDLREFLAAKLFEAGRLTMGQAAELAGQPVWLFLETLYRLNVSVINLNAEELRNEFAEA